MLSSYLTGRESPTLKTLDKLLDGLKLRLDDLAAALGEIQGHLRPRPVPITNEELVLGFPREEIEKVFVDQLRRLGIEPRKKADQPASPKARPRKPGKA